MAKKYKVPKELEEEAKKLGSDSGSGGEERYEAPRSVMDVAHETMERANKAAAIRSKYEQPERETEYFGQQVITDLGKEQIRELKKLDLPQDEHNKRLRKILPGVKGETDKTGRRPKRKR